MEPGRNGTSSSATLHYPPRSLYSHATFPAGGLIPSVNLSAGIPSCTHPEETVRERSLCLAADCWLGPKLSGSEAWPVNHCGTGLLCRSFASHDFGE